MATATLERDTTTIDIPLVTESSGQPLVATDLGKPNMVINGSGALDPRHRDHRSGLEQYTLIGRFTDANAYSDARDVMDLIKSHSGYNDMTLNIDMPEFDTNILVAPAAGQEEALNVVFQPGRRDYVEIDLGLTRINQVRGDPADITLQDFETESTPTASGTGPIQLSGGGRTVDMKEGVTVSRSVGRPNSVIRQTTNSIYPNYIDKRKEAYDAFEIDFEVIDGDTTQRIQDIIKIVQRQLEIQSITLDFNGLYGLGSFDVVPFGSSALRHNRQSGEQGTMLVPSLNLRRVLGT